jgi:stringent starvation protein B
LSRSKIPFLIKGLLDWMVEEDLTPYLVVNANVDGVQVPAAFVQADGTITLNLSGHAVRHFAIESDGLGFNSRFQGQSHSIWVPISAILGLVSQETSDGLWFPENQPSVAGPSQGVPNDAASETSTEPDQAKDGHEEVTKAEKPRGRPNLTIVE